jgi:protocatechuate 3,4-dioxygenase beta subunit
MENNNNIPRRKWLKLGFGLAAGTMGSAFAISKISKDKDDCILTPRQELGPFPPMEFRGQADHDIDLTKISEQSGTATGEIIVVQGKIHNTDCNPVEGASDDATFINGEGYYLPNKEEIADFS